MADMAELYIKVDSKGVVTASKDLDKLTGASKATEQQTGKVTKATDQANATFQKQVTIVNALAAAFGAYTVARQIQEATLLAARYETLGVVMQTVGNNAGYTGAQMATFQAGLERAGISMNASRQTLVQMAQAQLDLTKSTDMARIAQDAAVIGQINSSEAFERMIHGIQSGQVETLRTIGINVNFERGYQEVAKATGRVTAQMSEQEKAQIRANVVMEAGARIAGTYEAAMGTAGKQMLSLERHVENLQVLLGQAFTPVLAEIVSQITTAITGMNSSLAGEGAQAVHEWGVNFEIALIKIESRIMKVATFLDKIGGTWTGLRAKYYGVGAKLESALDLPNQWGYTERYQNAFDSNLAYEDRYNQTLADIENNQKRVADLEASLKAQQTAAQDNIRQTTDGLGTATQIQQDYIDGMLLRTQIEIESINARTAAWNQYFETVYGVKPSGAFAQSLTGLGSALPTRTYSPALGMTGSALGRGASLNGGSGSVFDLNYRKEVEKTTESFGDMGRAIQELGGAVVQLNDGLGRTVYSMGNVITQFKLLNKDGIGTWGTLASGMSIAGSMITIMQSIADSLGSSGGRSPVELRRQAIEEYVLKSAAYVSEILRTTRQSMPIGMSTTLIGLAQQRGMTPESLSGAAGSYSTAFLSEPQKQELIYRELAKTFNVLGESLPATRDGFRDLVEGLDLLKHENKEAYLTLLSVADMADQYYTYLEQRQEEARKKAEADLRAAFAAEKQRLTDLYSAEMIVLNQRLTATQQVVFDLTRGVEKLRAAKERLFPLTATDAMGQMATIIGQARQGDFSGLKGIDPVLSALTSLDTSKYATSEAYQRDYLKSARMISELESLTSGQLTVEERSLSALEQLAVETEKRFQEEMTRMDAQLNALLGIDTSVKTVAEAIRQWTAYMQGVTPGYTPPPSSGTPSTFTGFQYPAYAGSPVGDPLEEPYSPAMRNQAYLMQQSGGNITAYVERLLRDWTIDEVRDYLQDMYGTTFGFASGGVHSGGLRVVGERGPELEFTGPSRIVSNADSKKLLDTSRLEAEVRELRAELKAAMFQVAKNTLDTAKILKQFDRVGMPAERNF